MFENLNCFLVQLFLCQVEITPPYTHCFLVITMDEGGGGGGGGLTATTLNSALSFSSLSSISLKGSSYRESTVSLLAPRVIVT